MSEIIIPWYGNHASIPLGWSRYTALDGKFPKASGAESAGVTGGATTHTHASPGHTHALNAHTHTATSGDSDGGTGSSDGGTNLSNKSHSHTSTSGAASGGDTDSTAVTYAATSNNPPYLELIFIKSTQKNIPDDGIILWDQSSAPANTALKVTDGTLSTVDLNNKYLKSAATSGNAGGTGGSTTNTHSINHTHTTNTHTHASATTSGSANIDGQTNDSAGVNTKDHDHIATFAAGTEPIDSYTTPLVTAETVEPAYKMLMAYQNKSGLVQPMPLETIAMTVDSVPSGWQLCDGSNGTLDLTDKYIKITTSSGNIGNTGGSNTHSHAAQSHTHVSTGGHTHSVSYDSYTGAHVNVGSGVQDVGQTHTHSTQPSDNTNPGYASATTSANSSSNEPEYVIVKYIQRKTAAGGAMIFFAQMLSLAIFLMGSFSAFLDTVDTMLAVVSSKIDNNSRMAYT